MWQSLAERTDPRAGKLWLLLIVALGLGLRLWRAGANVFWADELGVAGAAFQPTLALALQAAHAHIMAMPLDYVTAWLMAHVSHAEGILRLPEVLWGSLTILAGYALALRLSASKGLARLAALLTALSPILIEYSQELRFYAPLTFFFTLSLVLGLGAVQRSRFIDWLLFTLAALVGLYFHFYVILVLGSVFLWLFLSARKVLWQDRRLAYFAGAMLLLLLGFAIGLAQFGNVFANPIPLFLYETFPAFVFAGLGWIPPFPASPAGWIAGLVCLMLAVLGFGLQVRREAAGYSCVLFYSAVLQVTAVIALDLLKNYFASARQLLMLAPVMAYFSACGLEACITWMAARLKRSDAYGRLSVVFSLLLVCAFVPVLWDYYHVGKGSVQEILTRLSEGWQAGQPVYVEPDYSLDVFAYYLGRQPGSAPLLNAMVPVDLASGRESGWQTPGPAWMVSSYPPAGWEGEVRAAGYAPIYLPPQNTLYAQMLWRRP